MNKAKMIDLVHYFGLHKNNDFLESGYRNRCFLSILCPLDGNLSRHRIIIGRRQIMFKNRHH